MNGLQTRVKIDGTVMPDEGYHRDNCPGEGI